MQIKKAEFKYRPDGSPELFTLDSSTNNTDLTVRTSFNGTVAVTEGTQGGQPINVTQSVTAIRELTEQRHALNC